MSVDLSFLDELKVFSFDKTFEVEVKGIKMAFRVLKADDQMKVVQYTSDSVNSLTQQALFISQMRLNTLAYSLVRINDQEFPNPDTAIYDEEGNRQGTVFDRIKEEISNWNEWVYNYVAMKVEEKQKELYDGVKAEFGLSFEPVDVGTNFDYENDVDRIEKAEDEVMRELTNTEKENEYETQATHDGGGDGYLKDEAARRAAAQQHHSQGPTAHEQAQMVQEPAPVQEPVPVPTELPSQEEYRKQKMAEREQADSPGIVGTRPMPTEDVKKDMASYANHMADIRKSPRIVPKKK